MSGFEIVHTMTDYYDGPRGGVADFRGTPHVYKSTFSDVGDVPDDAADVFQLSAIPHDAFLLALEDWAIWLRWETAFHRGETSHDTHPALPADHKRHAELQLLLDDRLEIDRNSFVLATAEFRVRHDPNWSGLGFRPLKVKWSPASPVA